MVIPHYYGNYKESQKLPSQWNLKSKVVQECPDKLFVRIKRVLAEKLFTDGKHSIHYIGKTNMPMPQNLKSITHRVIDYFQLYTVTLFAVPGLCVSPLCSASTHSKKGCE